MSRGAEPLDDSVEVAAETKGEAVRKGRALAEERHPGRDVHVVMAFQRADDSWEVVYVVDQPEGVLTAEEWARLEVDPDRSRSPYCDDPTCDWEGHA